MRNIVNRLSNVNRKLTEMYSITPDNFNSFFINHINDISIKIPQSNTESLSYLSSCNKQTSTFSFKYVSVGQVYATIHKLSNSNCLDVNGLNSYILKISSSFICEVIIPTYLTSPCKMILFFPKESKKHYISIHQTIGYTR